jgi:hypothetical protein
VRNSRISHHAKMAQKRMIFERGATLARMRKQRDALHSRASSI